MLSPLEEVGNEPGKGSELALRMVLTAIELDVTADPTSEPSRLLPDMDPALDPADL